MPKRPVNDLKHVHSNELDSKNVFPQLMEAFTVSIPVLLNDKLFVYVRPTNELAYNNLVDTDQDFADLATKFINNEAVLNEFDPWKTT
jgi:hypothetical protein